MSFELFRIFGAIYGGLFRKLKRVVWSADAPAQSHQPTHNVPVLLELLADLNFAQAIVREKVGISFKVDFYIHPVLSLLLLIVRFGFVTFGHLAAKLIDPVMGLAQKLTRREVIAFTKRGGFLPLTLFVGI